MSKNSKDKQFNPEYLKYEGAPQQTTGPLVLQAKNLKRGPTESTGEAQFRKIDQLDGRMGDRYKPETAPSELKGKSTKPKKSHSEEYYLPKNSESREEYDKLLDYIQPYLGEYPDLVKNAAEEILVILKDDNMNAPSKLKELDGILSGCTEETLSDLTAIAKNIHDFTQRKTSLENEELALDFDQVKSDDEEEGVIKEDEMSDEERESIQTDATGIPFSLLNEKWMVDRMGMYFKDSNVIGSMIVRVLDCLAQEDDSEAENQLVDVLGVENFDLIRVLLENRWKIWYALRLEKSRDRDSVIEEMNRLHPEILAEKVKMVEKKVLDLDSIAFEQGSHLNSCSSLKLPENTIRTTFKTYEEVSVAPLAPPEWLKNEKLIPITSMPKWAQAGFKGFKELNRVQSRLYDDALFGSENLLLSAPTGCGKTNVAMLTILHEIGLHVDPEGTTLTDLNFKIIYIAPMKALVQEIVGGFSSRLKDYGISVQELTGDRQMNKFQIHNTQIIVTTPEKWDIVSRKTGDKTLLDSVKLIIIDEIHLLHDDRGAILESIVARTLRQQEISQEMIRIVGLSATLPNFKDVASFLRVNKDQIYHFESAYRPVPLQTQYVGITEKKALKRVEAMNEIAFKKVMEKAGKKQVLVFVHSRKETAKSAKDIRDRAIHQDSISLFLKGHTTSRDILADVAKKMKDADLKDLVPFGIGIHHAGLTRDDRQYVEDLFADGHLQVLVSTATLAWGVNLPAHTVIIKGTQVYNPEKSSWMELSILDVCQMIGRAGRIKYDTDGEGIIITTQQEIQFYLTLMTEQLPIESQFVKKLADQLNAEIVSGTVTTMAEAIHWLTYTYLFVRMIRNPTLYGISYEEIEEDNTLEKRRTDLIHTAAVMLDKSQIIKYDRRTGNFQSTDLGQVASFYYISHKSIASYNGLLKPQMSDIEIFRLFAASNEFSNMMVRREEKLELTKLLQRVPIPVKESVDENSSKVNVLLQAYISRLKLDGYALVSDMTYVTQSAGRIVRALFEISLKRGWAQMAEKCLDLSKMIDKRMWKSQSPLRQFTGISEDAVKKLEKKDIPWERMYDLSAGDLNQALHDPKIGKQIFQHIRNFPRLDLTAHVQPITRSMLRVDLTVSPDFQFSDQVHGNAESFWVWVLDVDCETIIHSEYFVLKKRYSSEEHYLSFTVQMTEPIPPQYFVKITSDRWLQSETCLPVSCRSLILPEKFNRPTELLDVTPLPFSALKNKEFEPGYAGFLTMNPIQTQTFNALYHSDEPVFVGAPKGSGKTACAEFAMLRNFSRNGVTLFVCDPSSVELRQKQWSSKFKFKVSVLTGDVPSDLARIQQSSVCISTPEIWDVISRRWKVRNPIQLITLFIIDDLHLIGGMKGPVIEVITSRMRQISSLIQKPIRIVALSSPIANSKDLCDWLGVKQSDMFNFHPSARPTQLELIMEGYIQDSQTSRVLAMIKSTNIGIKRAEGKPCLLFAATPKLAKLAAFEIIGTMDKTVDTQPFKSYISDQVLLTVLEFGVATLHEGMTEEEILIVERLYQKGTVKILVATFEFAWKLDVQAHTVIILGTQTYNVKEHRYSDVRLPDLLEMIGKACRPSLDLLNRSYVFTHSSKLEYYSKFLKDPFPVESHLDLVLSDHVNAEIVTKSITNKQETVDYLTWTFLYRRIRHNPNYYNLFGNTNRHISDYLSELVENVLNDLAGSKCIAIDDEDVSPLNLGMISAHYYINHSTIELFNASLTASTKVAGLIEILSAASEFGSIPLRNGDDKTLRELSVRSGMGTDSMKFNDPHTKVQLILQSHFSRAKLGMDLEGDKKFILGESLRLIQAMVDVISSNRWLSPAIAAMELSQMLVQALWDRDSPLLQLPWVTKGLVDEFQRHDVKNIYQLTELDDEERLSILKFDEDQLSDLALAINRYPNIDLKFQMEKDVICGDQASVLISFEIEEEQTEPIHAPFYPKSKFEEWWIVLGDPETNQLCAVKRLPIKKSGELKLDFIVPDEPGQKSFKLFLMCDAYMGCDQEYQVEFQSNLGEDRIEEE